MNRAMIPFTDLYFKLSNRLQEPLPGLVAYERVKVKRADGGKIDFKEQANRRQGAVLIAFYEDEAGVHFPLIQRPDYDGVHSKQIALPGGKREENDADLIQTALRESHEEVGIYPEEVEVVGSLSSFYVGASNFQVLPVVGFLKSKPNFIPQPTEVDEIILGPLLDFLRPDAIKEKTIDVRGFSMRAPYFDVKGKVIWGATAAMLSELMMIIEEL